MRFYAGNQASLQYQQTVGYFKPLWKQLRQRAVHPEMVAGLHMIIADIKNRNYLHAYSIYVSLAIGTPRPSLLSWAHEPNPRPVSLGERSCDMDFQGVVLSGGHPFSTLKLPVKAPICCQANDEDSPDGRSEGRCCGRAGNNPWPIGVTSVGIHERSAREKISHVMNGGAHIMNDEATRKYLQAGPADTPRMHAPALQTTPANSAQTFPIGISDLLRIPTLLACH
jgi:hypothetical protein